MSDGNVIIDEMKVTIWFAI